MQKLLIFPCNSTALEALDAAKDFEVIGFVDDTREKQGKEVAGLPVYNRSAFSKFPDALVLAVPGGPTTYLKKREQIESLKLPPERFANVIHPKASVSSLAKLGHNILLMAGVVVTSNAVFGNHICILPNAVIHHDCVIEDHNFIGTNVSVSGTVTIGSNCYIGGGSNIINNVSIGENTLVGLGTNIIRPVGANKIVVGNPAREID
jgi:sugar O-acyltransferase (sialic acid O-acetyltransferase NeuD family)